MSAFYDEMLMVSNELITEFGVQYSFSRKTMGKYNVEIGRPELEQLSIYKVYAVIDTEKQAMRQDSNATDSDLIMIAMAADYKNGDTVEIDGQNYTVMRFNPIRPGGTGVATWVYLNK